MPANVSESRVNWRGNTFPVGYFSAPTDHTNGSTP